MANPQFPSALTGIQDSKNYQVQLEDTSMRTPLEGGYVVSRARTTRAPRRVFTTGFSDLNDTYKAILDDFWAQMGGGAVVFDWVDPAGGVTYAVRFGSSIGTTSSTNNTLQWKYTGMGPTRRWDVTFDLEQA